MLIAHKYGWRWRHPSRWNLQTPSSLPDDDNQKVYKRWRRDLELYLDLAMSDCDRSTKVKMVHYLLGAEARDLYDTFGGIVINKYVVPTLSVLSIYS